MLSVRRGCYGDTGIAGASQADRLHRRPSQAALIVGGAWPWVGLGRMQAMKQHRQPLQGRGGRAWRDGGAWWTCSTRTMMLSVRWCQPSRSPSTAQIGPCVEMPLEGVPEGCSGARARRARRRHWYAGRRGPLGVCHVKASSPPSNVATPCEHPPISCSPTASHGRVWRCLLRACRSVAQALEHEGKGDATGTEGVGNPQERAMPTPHRRQASWAPRVSVAVVALASRIAHVRRGV